MHWTYYEEGKEKRYTLTELKNFFETSKGLAEQKKQGTDFDSWLAEMEHMQILNRYEGNVSYNKVKEAFRQAEEWRKRCPRGAAAIMLHTGNGDVWTNCFIDQNSYKAYDDSSIVRVPLQDLIWKATSDHPLSQREIVEALFRWCADTAQ